MNNIIKKNLERRFGALLENKRKDYFVFFELEYVEYLSKIKEISDIISRLLDKDKVDKKTLLHLFIIYNVNYFQSKIDKGFSEKEILSEEYKLPSFITKEIENKLHILEEYRALLGRERDAYEKNKSTIGLKLNSLESREDDLFLLQRLHNNIMEELSSEDNDFKLYFDENKSILGIKGEKIKIRKFSDQYHLLRIIFDDNLEFSKEWFFSEIVELAGGDYEDKKFYNATDQVKKKIAIETGIKDFFITTRQSLKINNKYLNQ